MNNTMIPLIASFLSAVIVTAVGLPLIIKACRRFKYFDFPDERKVHRTPVPRLGGLIFMPSAVVGLFVASWTQVLMGGEEFVFGVSTIAMTFGGLIIYLIGFIDDRYGMKASHKFVIQAVAAFILPLCNLVITDLRYRNLPEFNLSRLCHYLLNHHLFHTKTLHEDIASR